MDFGSALGKDELNQNKEQSTYQTDFFLTERRIWEKKKNPQKTTNQKNKQKNPKQNRKSQYLCIGQGVRARGNKVYLPMLLDYLSSSIYDLFGRFKNNLKW